MPSFDFSLPKNKIQKRKTYKDYNRNEILLKNVKGIVWINSNAEYSVSIENDGKYPICKDCYSCKGHETIYRRGVPFKERYIYIREYGKYTEQNPNHYLPFAPGCIVIGNLILNSFNNKVFVIKKCYIELDNEESHKAVEFYKNHINEINNIIKIQLFNES